MPREGDVGRLGDAAVVGAEVDVASHCGRKTLYTLPPDATRSRALAAASTVGKEGGTGDTSDALSDAVSPSAGTVTTAALGDAGWVGGGAAAVVGYDEGVHCSLRAASGVSTGLG